MSSTHLWENSLESRLIVTYHNPSPQQKNTINPVEIQIIPCRDSHTISYREINENESSIDSLTRLLLLKVKLKHIVQILFSLFFVTVLHSIRCSIFNKTRKNTHRESNIISKSIKFVTFCLITARTLGWIINLLAYLADCATINITNNFQRY